MNMAAICLCQKQFSISTTRATTTGTPALRSKQPTAGIFPWCAIMCYELLAASRSVFHPMLLLLLLTTLIRFLACVVACQQLTAPCQSNLLKRPERCSTPASICSPPALRDVPLKLNAQKRRKLDTI